MSDRRTAAKKTDAKSETSTRTENLADHVPGARTALYQSAHLQRALGNQALAHLVRSGSLQRKLTVSRPDDSYEQEVDRVADQVMRMPDAEISRQLSGVSKQSGMIQTKPG